MSTRDRTRVKNPLNFLKKDFGRNKVALIVLKKTLG